MNDSCIYCGATDHEVVDTIIGKVQACPRMPMNTAIMMTKSTLVRLVNLPDELQGECIECGCAGPCIQSCSKHWNPK